MMQLLFDSITVPLICYPIVILFHCFAIILFCYFRDNADCQLHKEVTKAKEISECMPVQIMYVAFLK